jgi:hypothetical protein
MYRDANVPTCQLWDSAARVRADVLVVHVSLWAESEYQQGTTLRISDHQPSRLLNGNHLFGSEEREKHESKSGGEKSQSRGAAIGPIDSMKDHVILDGHFPFQTVVIRLQHIMRSMEHC